MQRLIDANALKEYIDCGHLRNPCEVCFSELDVVNLIDAQPTIEAELVRHGRWILDDVQDEEENANDNFRYHCSCCGYSDLHAKNQTVPYCWHCGARMDEE